MSPGISAPVLLEAHFDAAAAVAGAEGVGGDVVDFRPLEEQKRAEDVDDAFEHEGRLDDADVEVEMVDAGVGDARHVDERIAFAAVHVGAAIAAVEPPPFRRNS